jgi:sodium-dependent dicarboxylate transporter 2/3/5
MAFAFPLTIGMLFASFLFLSWNVRRNKNDWTLENSELGSSTFEGEGLPYNKYNQIGFLVILVGTVFLWLSEPLHKIPAAVIPLGSAATLFLSGILAKKDLLRIDWSTLLLIAGGITFRTIRPRFDGCS